MQITTATGFKCEIEDEALDDMELLEGLIAIDNGDASFMPFVLNRLLGDNKQALYDHVRTESGRVPTKALSEELGEIFKALSPDQKK